MDHSSSSPSKRYVFSHQSFELFYFLSNLQLTNIIYHCTSFMQRPKVAKEFPGIKFVDMGVILGERWRALPAADKAPYEEKAAEDKQRFNKEMEEYTAKRIAAEPHHPMAAVADYGQLEAPAAASSQAQYGEQQQHYAEQQAAAAAAHHAYFAGRLSMFLP